jgi:hypothetical protein
MERCLDWLVCCLCDAGADKKGQGRMINKILAFFLTITIPFWILPVAVIFFMVEQSRDTYNDILNQLEERSKK